MRTFTELSSIPTFVERYRYLKIGGKVGDDTFGFDRYLNQVLYHSSEWQDVRNQVILRDNGCDLGIQNKPIEGPIYVHHMNPFTAEDIELRSDILLNPEYLICTSFKTHQAIHYGDESDIVQEFTERKPFDTCPWKGINNV